MMQGIGTVVVLAVPSLNDLCWCTSREPRISRPTLWLCCFLCAELKLVAARWKLVEGVVQNVGQAWQMHQIGCHLSAQHLWSRDERAIAQVRPAERGAHRAQQHSWLTING
jgi:hypothetical protein